MSFRSNDTRKGDEIDLYFRFMLLEKQQRENKARNSEEPDFHPKYRKQLPPGLDIKQVFICVRPKDASRT